MTHDHVFEVPFCRYDNYGGVDVVEFEDDRDDEDEFVVFQRSAWEAMGQPQRVRVTVEPVGDTPESDPSETAIALLPRDRLVREAQRAHKALLRYGKHDDGCPQHPDSYTGDTCDCGLDAAGHSPFVVENDEGEDVTVDAPDAREVIARILHQHDSHLARTDDWRDCPSADIHGDVAMRIADALGLEVGE